MTYNADLNIGDDMELSDKVLNAAVEIATLQRVHEVARSGDANRVAWNISDLIQEVLEHVTPVIESERYNALYNAFAESARGWEQEYHNLTGELAALRLIAVDLMSDFDDMRAENAELRARLEGLEK